MIPLEEVILTIFLVTSFSISIWENPKEKYFVPTELKQTKNMLIEASSKLKSSFNSYFASFYKKNRRFSYD